jgi:FtsZ-interacting cell division protein ZipA
MSQLIFFDMFRRLSMRMRVEPCLAESGRKGPPATSHVCTGAQGHFPREPDRPAEPGRDRNRSGKTEHHNKKKEEKKEDQKQERKTQEKEQRQEEKKPTPTQETQQEQEHTTPPPNQNQNTRKNTMRVLHLAARKPP